jgi:hypothetical protein
MLHHSWVLDGMPTNRSEREVRAMNLQEPHGNANGKEMVIEYIADRSDIAAFYSYSRKHSTKFALLSYALPIGIVALFLGVISFGRRPTTTDWIIALIWGVAIYFQFPRFLRSRTKKNKRILSIQPDKLSTTIGKLSGDVPWTKVDSLNVTDEHIFLIRKNMNGFAIPRRAFVDEAQRMEFIRLCEKYIQAARN